MRIAALILITVLFSCSNDSVKDEQANMFSSGKWVDLSYDFSDKTLYWPTAEGFRLDTAFEGITDNGFYYSAYNFCAAEHGGTHLDAPVHFAKGKWSADQIPIENLMGNVAVIDVSEKALKDPDYLISTDDITAWENVNGKLEDNIVLFFRTGYGAFYPDAKKYLGTEERGADAVAKLHFPSIDPEAADWLVKNRKIRAVGIDVASVDYGQSKNFKTHQVLYGNNIPGFENVAYMDQLPVKGAYIIALPMKIKGGSGGPLRIIAYLP